jgi:hypothetical protein
VPHRANPIKFVIPSSFVAAKRRGRARNLLSAGSHPDARVERTLLSVAFDVALDVDSAPPPRPQRFWVAQRFQRCDKGLSEAARVERAPPPAAFDFDNDCPQHRGRAALQRRVRGRSRTKRKARLDENLF